MELPPSPPTRLAGLVARACSGHHSSELADALPSAVNPQAKSAQATSESSGSGHHGSVLADALPEFAAQAACKPQAAGKPQATSSASNVISHPFPVTGLLPRTSLQTPAPRDSNHCGGQCPSSPTQVAGLDLQHLANALARQSRLPNAALKRNNSKGCGASK